MQRFCTGVLAGCLLSLFLPALPVFFEIILLSALLLSLLCRQALLAGVLALLISWHWQLHAYLIAQKTLLAANHPPAMQGSIHNTDIGILVQIIHFRQLDAADLDVLVSIKQGEAQGYRLKLRWRNAPTITVGQQWRLSLQLRPIRNQHNPGRRQPEIQALLQAIIAEGYVKPQQPALLLKDGSVWRQHMISKIRSWTAEKETAPLLLALTVGEREFSDTLWRGVQYSGLGHILTISGLHIGLVFGWGYLLSGLLLKSRFCNKLNNANREVGQWLFALFLAFCYAWLAGFAIPTLRATTALLLLMGSRLLLKPLNGRFAWQFLVALLLLLNPLWVLSYSFWLSVLAVAVILLLHWWLPPLPSNLLAKLSYFFLFHFLLTTVMSLIGLAFFGGTSTLAIFSNLLFVSWCSVLAIPVLLVTLCWSLLNLPYSQLLWQLTDGLFQPLWYWLMWCADQPIWWSTPLLGMAASLLLAAAVLIVLALRLPWQPKLLLLITLVLALNLPLAPSPRLLLLDTGQSTVLLGQHNQFNWLYLDANTTQIEGLIRHQVLPQLRYQRMHKLDLVLIPRLEREMQPALQLLKQQFPKVRFYSATPVIAGSYPCQQIMPDYAKAGFVHWPLVTADPCVISITLAGWRLLLPGALTTWQEQQLLHAYPHLQADVYLLAAYGRASANSLAWLQQLSPRLLLLAANDQGAYRYPLAGVQQRIDLLGLSLYHSGKEGALILHFNEDQLQVIAQKQQSRLRWLEKPAE